MSALRIALLALLVGTVSLSGCVDSRDIDDEAADRAEYARTNDAYAPVARLAGPSVVAPGALVWFNAEGSHDPDFIGAKTDRDRARADGGFHAHAEGGNGGTASTGFTFSWDGGFDRSLGDGIREYRWQVDDKPVLVAPELTHRYGTEDGPVRFPFGFVDEGRHRLELTVEDWSGETDTISVFIEVAENGAQNPGDLAGWRVTENGWELQRQVDLVTANDYGECPLGRNTYDAPTHRMVVPWDLVYYMDNVGVTATWSAMRDPTGAFPAGYNALNTNDVDLTLGHCGNSEVWERFESEAQLNDNEPVETGEASGAEFAQHLEKTGEKHGYLAEWDFNAFHSDSGAYRGGSGTQVTLTWTFTPASDTRGGAL